MSPCREGCRTSSAPPCPPAPSLPSPSPPLPASSSLWLADNVGVQVASISGGTDIVSAFAGGSTGVPVVPGELSVVGFDDSILMQFTNPPLTTVRQPVEALARATVDRLQWQLQGQEPPRHGEVLFAPELVVRGTTAAVG